MVRQEFVMLADAAEAVGGKIYILGGGTERHLAPGRDALEPIARRLGELELYVDTARNLHDALQPATLRSVALQRLRTEPPSRPPRR